MPQTAAAPRTLTDRYQAEFPDEEARGGKGLCRITVNEAYRIVPPTDEELWALLEVEDAERFDAAVRERIREAVRAAYAGASPPFSRFRRRSSTTSTPSPIRSGTTTISRAAHSIPSMSAWLTSPPS